MEVNHRGQQHIPVSSHSSNSSKEDTMAADRDAQTGQEGQEATAALHEKDVEARQHSPAEEEAQPVRQLHGIKWLICVISIFSSVFLYALDNTIVATIQPAIIDSLGHLDRLAWVSVSYQVTSVALDLTWGKLFAKFNGKPIFLAAIIIFEIGSAVCGAAPSMDSEIVGRAICGVGGIGIYMGALNLLASTTTDAERPVYISLMGICWGSGTVLGPIIGGAFADSTATWRWSFYINLVIGAVFAPAYIFILPSTNKHMRAIGRLERWRSIDWVGTILISGAVVSGIMAINFGGVLFAWRSGQIIGCFVCSGVCFIFFGFQQAYAIFTTPEDRIFPCDIILNFEANALFAQTACGLGGSLVAIYFIPLYYQFVRREQTLEAGVRLLPMMFLMILASILAGTLLGRGVWFAPFALIGGILVVIAGSLMYTLVGINTSAAPIYGFSILLGFGAGLYTQGPISVVQSLFPVHRVADATAFVGFGQVTGIVIMLALANAIFLNKATSALQQLLPGASTQAIQAAIQGVDNEILENLSTDVRSAASQAVVDSMNYVYVLVIVAGAVSILLCPLVRRPKKT